MTWKEPEERAFAAVKPGQQAQLYSAGAGGVQKWIITAAEGND